MIGAECEAGEQNSLRRHYGKDKEARLPPMYQHIIGGSINGQGTRPRPV